MSAEFLRSLEYDRWANRRWLPFVESNDALQAIFAHVLNAQAIWYRRVGNPGFALYDRLEDQIEENFRAWQGVLSDRESGEIIHYKNLAGVPQSRLLGDIVMHVINHGTYHRGQMRALAGDHFPETDFILFAIETD
jgi:hypothetical protein